MSDPQKLPATPGDPRGGSRVLHRDPVRRFSTSLDPDRAPSSSLDPVLTRQGGVMAHKSILFMVLAGLLVLAYAFNLGALQTTLDSAFNDLNRSVQSRNDQVVSTVLTVAPYVGMLIAALILFFLLRGLFRGAKNITREVRLARREELTIDEFVKLASEHGVSPKVSREAYRLLLPHYSGEMRAQLGDSLSRDLHLGLHSQIELYASLLRKSDRVLRALEDKDAKQPETVLELLQAVHNAPQRAAMPHPSKVRTAIRHLSFIRPAGKQ